MSKGRKRKPSRSGRKGRPGRPSTPRQPLPLSTEEDFDPTRYLGDVPPSTAQAEVDQILERRVFAVLPGSTTLEGEDYDWLDPADPDERGLLIKGEHPEYHELLADPAFQGEIDGHNPRFHLTMHEVIANQLWDNDPPEVWLAAQRRRDQGVERHEILHELLTIMIEHMWPTLAKGESFDTDAYRQALDNLGR